MKYSPSVLYSETIPSLKEHFRRAVSSGLSQRTSGSRPCVFFRADDIGVPSSQFSEMASLFIRYNTPLCLAVVPSWLTRQRLLSLQVITGGSRLFCWHQHGWRHTNHELSGKKQEFGPGRPVEDLGHDISCGRERLHGLLGEAFSPFFTPPWNRCGMSTLKILKDLKFKGISRSKGATPPAPDAFPDFQVTVDLHTRKEQEVEKSFKLLLQELEISLTSGTTGIMLHHQRMNNRAYHLLESLLQILAENPEITLVSFDNLHPGLCILQ